MVPHKEKQGYEPFLNDDRKGHCGIGPAPSDHSLSRSDACKILTGYTDNVQQNITG